MPGIQYDEYGRPMTPTFRTPQDFVRYVEGLGEQATAGARRQADEIRRNPGGWQMSMGHPRKKDDWLAANLPWLGPAIVTGGALAAAALPAGAAASAGGGGAAAGSAAPLGGVLPSAHLPAASLMGGPAAITSQGASGLVGAGAGAGGSMLGRIGRNTVDALTSGRGVNAMMSLLPMLMASRGGGAFGDAAGSLSGPLGELANMSVERARRTDPLHQMVTRLAASRMPISSRG